MKLFCEVEVKDTSPRSKFDAIAYACRHDELWKFRESKSEQRQRTMQRTNLKGKCGSCRHFCPIQTLKGESCYGNCAKGRVTRPRTVKGCKAYEVKK